MVLVTRVELVRPKVWAWYVCHSVIPANGRCEKTRTSTDPPYERSVLLFELHSIKMVGEVGVEPTMFTLWVADLQSVGVATSHTLPWLKWRKWQDSNPHATSLRLLAVFKTAPLPIRVTLPYGGSNWTWTNDAHAFNVSLYQLSYRAIMVEPKGLAPLP